MGKKREEEQGGNWMDTYGDMVTLLLTFFVMLYSMSSISEEKWAMLVRAFNMRGADYVDQIVFGYSSEDAGSKPFKNTAEGNNVGPMSEEQVEELDELFVHIQQYVEQNEMQENISLSLGDEAAESMGESEDGENESIAGENAGQSAKNIYIQFKNDVLFLPDEAEIRPEANDVINFLGTCLANVEKDIAMVIIKGHTAVSPSSTVDSRLLSSERAGTISNVFEKEFKMPSTKLYPIGLSGDYPIADNSTEEGRKQNRRVEIVIISKKSDLAKSGELMKILGASFEANTGDLEDVVGD